MIHWWEIALFVLLILAGIGGATYFRIREERYLKKKTSEVFSKSLKEEIKEEQESAKRKKEKFEEALKKFDEESSTDSNNNEKGLIV